MIIQNIHKPLKDLEILNSSMKLEEIKENKEEHKKLKVLAVSDLHGDVSLVQKMAEKAEKENVDVVLICGDFSKFGENHEYMIGPFLKKGKRVLFVPGNHEGDDLADFISEVYKIKNLHGYSAVYGDVGFFGCGGANIGPNIKSESELMYALEKGFEKIKHMDKKILVSHIHPKDSKMENFSNFVPGSSSLTEAIKKFKPDFVVCGHVHEGQGIEEVIGTSKVLNVARDGKIFEI